MWCKELAHLKRPWCWERLKAGGEGDDREWDGWMASPTQWTWVWVGSGSWWWIGRAGVLQPMGSQRVGHDWATELNWYIFVVNSPTLKLLTSVYRMHSYFSSAFHRTISSCNYRFQFLTLRVFFKPVPIMICLHSSDTFLVKATRGFNSVISSGPHLISLHRAFNMITHLSLKPLSPGLPEYPSFILGSPFRLLVTPFLPNLYH